MASILQAFKKAAQNWMTSAERNAVVEHKVTEGQLSGIVAAGGTQELQDISQERGAPVKDGGPSEHEEARDGEDRPSKRLKEDGQEAVREDAPPVGSPKATNPNDTNAADRAGEDLIGVGSAEGQGEMGKSGGGHSTEGKPPQGSAAASLGEPKDPELG
eukprot:scaffold7824_cov457-Prasinococcus_capsulatus_cf.AAC.2